MGVASYRLCLQEGHENPKESSRGRDKGGKTPPETTHREREIELKEKDRKMKEHAHTPIEKGEGENRNLSLRKIGSLSKLRLITLK
jgi:hypothetical protein